MTNIKKMCYVVQEQNQKKCGGIYKSLLMVCFDLIWFLDGCLLSDFYVDHAGPERNTPASPSRVLGLRLTPPNTADVFL